MTLTPYEPRAEVALSNYQDAAVQRLGEWAQSANAAHEIAQTLVQTSFCPASFRGKPGEATAAILAGLEVGLQPMAALRSFDVISGQAAARAITLRAIVQSHGHDMVLVESTATRCRMKGRRRGSDEWQNVTWTIDRARDLQLTGKDNWRKQPAAMLVARATSELARLIASDAILGIGYSAEEVADGAGVESAVTVAEDIPESGSRRMSRRPAPETSNPGGPPDDRADEPFPSDEDAAPGSEPLLLDTKSKLAVAMYAGISADPDITEEERVVWCGNVIGRDITSTKEMTEDEAREVLRVLDQRKAERADQ